MLGVLITSKCNISCRHCCNDSHPKHKGSVEFEEIRKLIDGALLVRSIREIGISGGEPFLFLELLHRIAAYAGSSGLSASVTTNGFWGASPGILPHLARLKAEGVRAINISSSIFHQEFLRPERLIAAVRAANAADLQVTVNVVETSSFGRAEIEAILGDLADVVAFVVMPLLPAGRAAVDTHLTEYGDGDAVPTGTCRRHFLKLAVDRDGDAYPCCSPGGFTPALRLGSARQEGIPAMVAAARRNRLLAILDEVGPSFFLPFLRASNHPGLPERFSDQCHLCHVMLSDPELSAVVSTATDQLFDEFELLDHQHAIAVQ